MKVIIASTPLELQEFEQPLKDLAKKAISENIFYEDWMLLPAFELLRSKNVTIALVCSLDKKTLLGVFPLEAKAGYRHLPIKYYSLWRHMHCFLSTPLIRLGWEQECLRVFFSWLSKQTLGRYIFQFDQIAAEGAFFLHLKQFVQQNRLKIDVVESYVRPLLQSTLDGESYMRAAMSSKHLKDLRKKLTKLEQVGVVQYQMLTELNQLGSWLESFLQLEASGWKGRSDTAMRGREKEKLFFSAITANALNQDKLMFLKMSLDDKPIAMHCGFKGGKGAFSFKIAYDESFAKYSPGVLLEMEYIRHIQDHSEIEWVDSCSMPGNVMLSRIWMENRAIASLAVSADSTLSKCLISTVSRLKSMQTSVRASLTGV